MAVKLRQKSRCVLNSRPLTPFAPLLVLLALASLGFRFQMPVFSGFFAWRAHKPRDRLRQPASKISPQLRLGAMAMSTMEKKKGVKGAS